MPTALAKRLGSHHLAERKAEVEVPKGIPRVPPWASIKARAHWKRIAPWLYKVGLLTKLDQVALALLCEALTDFLCARDIVDEEAKRGGVRFVTKTEKGNIIQHPAVGVMNKAHERLVKLLVQFGMTPSARAGLAIAKTEAEKDPMTELLYKLRRRHGEN